VTVFSVKELRQRIRELREDGEHLDKLNYFGRQWVGSYAGNVDVIADCLEELLDRGGVTSVDSFATQYARGKKDAETTAREM
jgi:hypothetical protein